MQSVVAFHLLCDDSTFIPNLSDVPAGIQMQVACAIVVSMCTWAFTPTEAPTSLLNAVSATVRRLALLWSAVAVEPAQARPSRGQRQLFRITKALVHRERPPWRDTISSLPCARELFDSLFEAWVAHAGGQNFEALSPVLDAQEDTSAVIYTALNTSGDPETDDAYGPDPLHEMVTDALRARASDVADVITYWIAGSKVVTGRKTWPPAYPRTVLLLQILAVDVVVRAELGRRDIFVTLGPALARLAPSVARDGPHEVFLHVEGIARQLIRTPLNARLALKNRVVSSSVRYLLERPGSLEDIGSTLR